MHSEVGGLRSSKKHQVCTFDFQHIFQVLSLLCQLGNCSVSTVLLTSFSTRWLLTSFGVESSAFKRAALIRCPERKMYITHMKQCIMSLIFTKLCYRKVPKVTDNRVIVICFRWLLLQRQYVTLFSVTWILLQYRCIFFDCILFKKTYPLLLYIYWEHFYFINIDRLTCGTRFRYLKAPKLTLSEISDRKDLLKVVTFGKFTVIEDSSNFSLT